MSFSTAARALFVAGIFAFLSLLTTAAVAQGTPTVSWPPSPSVKLALNPVTNKVYTIDEGGRSVVVHDFANGLTKTIGVGSRPYYIAVNPGTNRIYVNDMNDANVHVIDGATDSVLAILPMGSIGPIQINPITNVIYVVRLTGPSTDEITYVNGDTDTYYTIATQSFQPIAMAINPVTDTIYAAHYATGDVRVISGAYSGNDHPATFSIGVWSRPFAITANPVTNKVYAITEDSRGPIVIIDGATRTASWPTIPAGRAVGPKAIAINTVTNKVYAAFQDEVAVVDGASGAVTFVPIGSTGGGAMEIAVNHATNKIYVAVDNGSLWVIDGATNAASAVGIPAGAVALGVNPVTNKAYVFNGSTTMVDGAAGATMANPITTSITPLANNSAQPNVTFTLNASSSFTPNAMPVRKVYYQLDSTSGAWSLASGSGPWTASFSGLSSGSHTLYAFATDGQDAPLYTSSASASLLGTMTSYAFTVGTPTKATPSVSLASSKNPAIAGESVTFTATVSGSAGTPTGTVDFLDGTTPICSAVALSGGTGTCSSTTLSTGSHSITARYSGDTAYATATSGAITQAVNAPKSTPTMSLSSSPNPSSPGMNASIVATLTAGTTAATGTVEFRAGGAVIVGCAAVAVASNKATCVTGSLAEGTTSLSAHYSGDASYNAATATSSHKVLIQPTITITSSKNPSMQGESVTFTVTVTGSAGTADGLIEFKNAAWANVCPPVQSTDGTATCTRSDLPAGSNLITAVYNGNSVYSNRNAQITQVVNGPKVNIGMSVISSPNPSEQGQSVSITAHMVATVAPASGGTVEFRTGSTVIAGCAAVPVFNDDLATCTTTALPVGTQTITASYSGNSAYNASTASVSHTVNPKPLATPTVSIASSRNPSTQGESVTFTARISGSAGATTGIVQFWNGGSTITGCNAVDASSGTATCTTSSLPVGSLEIRAHYSGNAAYNPGSATLTQVVNGAKTTIAVQLASSPNPSESGQAVSIVARLAATATAATGTVEFRDGGSVIAGCSAVTVSADMATCNTSALAAGTHTLTANYSGNAAYNPSSGSVTHVVNAAKVNVSTTLTASPSPSEEGQAVTLSASIAASGATGTVSFSDGGTVIAGCSAVAVSSNAATCTTSALAVGGHALQATYSGDAAYNASTSNTVSHTVNPKPAPVIAANLTFPTAGATLEARKQAFLWEGISGASYQLLVGSSLGASDLARVSTSRTSATVNKLPTDGRTVYVRLVTTVNGKSGSRDYTFFANSKLSATLESPKQLRRIDKSKETFKWSEVDGATYTLAAGTSVGSSNLGVTGTTETRIDMTGLPTNGKMVYVRLTTVKDGKTRVRDYAFGKDVEELDEE